MPMKFYDFQRAALAGCEVQVQSQRLLYNIEWRQTSKPRIPKNPRYDVSVSSTVYAHDGLYHGLSNLAYVHFLSFVFSLLINF